MDLYKAEESRRHRPKGGRDVRLRFILISFLVLLCSRPAAQELDRLSVWAYVEKGVCIANRTTEFSIRISNHGEEPVRDLTVLVREGEDPEVILVNGGVGVIGSRETRTVTGRVTPGWRTLSRREEVTLILISGGVPVTRTVQLITVPAPWLWPAAGGVLGAALITVFIWLFQRMNREEKNG